MRIASLLILTPLLTASLSAETRLILNKTSASEALDLQQITVPAGERVTLTVPVLSGNAWLKDGRPIPGAVTQTLTIESAAPADSGVYRLSYASDATQVSQAVILTVANANQTGGKFETFSTRGVAGSGEQSLVAGVIVSPTQGEPSATKRILVRAVGPTLDSFGVSGFLIHPQLKLYNVRGELMTPNDADSLAIADASLRSGAFPLKPNAGDVVQLYTVPAGAYTAQVSAPRNESGVVILDVYDVP
jgi:hypothetical protein